MMSPGTVGSSSGSNEGVDNLTVVPIANDTQGADDMNDQENWISYSHWGMFRLERKSSK
jgi:hypothetical protein